MLSGPKSFVALHLRWCLFFLVGTTAAVLWYAAHATGSVRWPGGGSLPGLAFGFIAGVIIFFECALWLRKTPWFRTRRWLGRAQLWMKAHIWLGLLTVPLVLLHSGFQFGGWLSYLLAWIFIVVIASGMLGLAIQNYLPRFMLDHVTTETVASQLDAVARQFLVDADNIVAMTCGDEQSSDILDQIPQTAAAPIAGTREIGARRRIGTQVARSPGGSVLYPQVRQVGELRRMFDTEIRRYLETGRCISGKLGGPRRDEEYFVALRKVVPPDAHTAISALQRLCERRYQLSLQARLQLVLQGWLLIHLPLSIALLILLIVHAYFALRFA